MSLSFLKTAVQSIFGGLGFDLQTRRYATSRTLTTRRIAAAAGPVRTIIDIGASDGRWSAETLQAFPGAKTLLIEAEKAHRAGLEAFIRSHPDSVYELAAASDHNGTVTFQGDGLFGGGVAIGGGSKTWSVPCVRVDDLVEKYGLEGPYLIKFDTHGHETEILNGAARTLESTSLLLLETYNFPAPDRLMFPEMCQHLAGLGFRPAAIADVMARPVDDLLWQMDIWFLPSSHPSFQHTGYQELAPAA